MCNRPGARVLHAFSLSPSLLRLSRILSARKIYAAPNAQAWHRTQNTLHSVYNTEHTGTEAELMQADAPSSYIIMRLHGCSSNTTPTRTHTYYIRASKSVACGRNGGVVVMVVSVLMRVNFEFSLITRPAKLCGY